MFPSTLVDEFRARTQVAILRLRHALPGAPALRISAEDPRLGAYAFLGAIGLGALMMMGARSHDHRAATVAAAEIVVPAQVKAAAKAASPAPDALAAMAAPSPALAQATEKLTARVDTTPTASIPDAPTPRLKHKHHRKAKPQDIQN
jgi:hypothetical protein